MSEVVTVSQSLFQQRSGLRVKKVGRISPGGGWWAHGCACPGAKASKRGGGARVDYTYLHTGIDGFSRLAYTEALDDEKASTTIGFFCRVRIFTVTLTSLVSRHHRSVSIPPRHNGKVERYNRILAEECLYARSYSSEQQRRAPVAV